MYVGGPLDTAPATPFSISSQSQASHREVKVRKVNSSHSASPPALKHQELGDQAILLKKQLKDLPFTKQRVPSSSLSEEHLRLHLFMRFIYPYNSLRLLLH